MLVLFILGRLKSGSIPDIILSQSGGIGRRARLKIWYPSGVCGFESHLWYLLTRGSSAVERRSNRAR